MHQKQTQPSKMGRDCGFQDGLPQIDLELGDLGDHGGLMLAIYARLQTSSGRTLAVNDFPITDAIVQCWNTPCVFRTYNLRTPHQGCPLWDVAGAAVDSLASLSHAIMREIGISSPADRSLYL